MSGDRGWYLSCPHGCTDPETCPYGRKHLVRIRALLQDLAEKKLAIEVLEAQREEARFTGEVR
ncbi:MAG: hypothetical protein GY769_08105 [bacterium]|nr:hypothetical protein [bacterium]